MKFTGRNLYRIYEALGFAISDLHNQIATCPDVFEYADDIEELEQQKAEFQRIKDDVLASLEREGFVLPPTEGD